MDPFGDSDLSDVSAPPTPGPTVSPRAASPGRDAGQMSSSDPADAAPTPAGRHPAKRRPSAKSTGSTAQKPPRPSSSRKNSTASRAASGAVSGLDEGVDASADAPALNRRASTRDRKVPAKLRSPSPRPAQAANASPAARDAKKTAAEAPDTPKSRLKVKLSVKSKASADGTATGDSGSSRAPTPQPSTQAEAKKPTLKKYGSKKKLKDELRDLADDDDDEHANAASAPEDARVADDREPAAEGGDGEGLAGSRRKSTGKRDRGSGTKAAGRRRTVIADDEDEDGEGAGKADAELPQRKRAKLIDGSAGGGRKGARPARSSKRTLDYSDDDDEDEAMVDAASDEDDLDLDAAAATDSEDEFEHEGGQRRGAGKAKPTKRAGDKASKAGGRASTGAVSKAAAGSGGGAKKASTAAASTGAGKAMSAEARMRASIDAAKDKSLKPPGVAATGSKLNPQASAFRPGSAVKAGTGGASTPTGPASGGSAKRPTSTGKPAFGKSMSGWDQLFGGISGLSSTSSSSTPTKATPTKPGAGSKPATPTAAAAGSGIRPDPVLEAASTADLQRLRDEANQQYLNTDECFDLLAHADIMLAFERSIHAEDRKLAARLRPAVYRAGQILVPKQQAAQPQQPAESAQ